MDPVRNRWPHAALAEVAVSHKTSLAESAWQLWKCCRSRSHCRTASDRPKLVSRFQEAPIRHLLRPLCGMCRRHHVDGRAHWRGRVCPSGRAQHHGGRDWPDAHGSSLSSVAPRLTNSHKAQRRSSNFQAAQTVVFAELYWVRACQLMSAVSVRFCDM